MATVNPPPPPPPVYAPADGRETPTNIDIIKLQFLELVMARERRKEKAKSDQKRIVMRVATSKTSRSL